MHVFISESKRQKKNNKNTHTFVFYLVRVFETSIQSHYNSCCDATPHLVINLSYRFDFINLIIYSHKASPIIRLSFQLQREKKKKKRSIAFPDNQQLRRKPNFLLLCFALHEWIHCILYLYLSLVSSSSTETKKLNHTGQTNQSVSTLKKKNMNKQSAMWCG